MVATLEAGRGGGGSVGSPGDGQRQGAAALPARAIADRGYAGAGWAPVSAGGSPWPACSARRHGAEAIGSCSLTEVAGGAVIGVPRPARRAGIGASGARANVDAPWTSRAGVSAEPGSAIEDGAMPAGAPAGEVPGDRGAPSPGAAPDAADGPSAQRLTRNGALPPGRGSDEPRPEVDAACVPDAAGEETDGATARETCTAERDCCRAR